MAFTLPTLSELTARCRALFGLAEPANTMRVTPNVHEIVARVLALLSFELSQRLAFLARQMFASTADAGPWLDRHGFELGLSRRAASKALGFATGTATTGTVFPAGLFFVRTDGTRFETVASAVAVASSVTFQLRAVDAGVDGNTGSGVSLSPESPIGISGLSGAITVGSAGLGGGAAAETDDEFRARVLSRKRNPPQGGSRADWERWALEVTGVTKAFVDTFANDQREVWVAFLFAGRVNGIPNSGDVAVVQAYLDDPNRRPVTARVTAVAPTTQAIDITVRIEPDTTDNRARVTAELQAMFTDRAGCATPNASVTFYRSWVAEAISRAVGENNHTLSAPSADTVISTSGRIPVLGTITWI